MHTLPRKESYREFCSKIAPSKHPFLGITLPILHHYSRSLCQREKRLAQKDSSRSQKRRRGIGSRRYSLNRAKNYSHFYGGI